MKSPKALRRKFSNSPLGRFPNALRSSIAAVAVILAASGLYAFQKPFRQYPGIEYDNFPLPPDWKDQSEFTFARLMYPQIRGLCGVQLAIEFGLHEQDHLAQLWHNHPFQPLSAAICVSIRRARHRRDMTVPMGVRVTSAISL